MSNQSVETVTPSSDKIKVSLALVFAIAGIVAFYFLAGSPTWQRSLPLFGGLVLAVGILWTSGPGRNFLSFAKESVRETRKVVWPSRKEAMQVTAVVFAFVFVMSLFLWGVDKILEYVLYDLILGWKK
ncbi:preprotein translocase subunit SecE [Massilia sp. W12]|uniref:preprotein translocase subunit SecE n=1 Tax=Massilia sp. W12 TaxID=3126507 RepID=UPI0030D26F23